MTSSTVEKEKTLYTSSPDINSLDQEKNTPVQQFSDDETGLEGSEDGSHYLSGVRLGLVMLGLCLAVLLVGLDNSILATAIPTITTAFKSLEDVGWYASAFLITVCALQPISGKLYTYFSLKWTYLSFLGLFEFGSLICATAVNSLMLIIGRAIAGMGAAGLFSGALVIIAYSIPLRQRPIYTGLVASMFGISNVAGPLLGGAFTENLSWRWCFYINLPLGAVTALILILFFRVQDRPTTKLPFLEKVTHLDLPGLFLFMPAVIMLLLALQWGGHGHKWNSPTIIGLFIGFGIMIGLFSAWQWKQQEEASIPPRIIRQRSVWSAVAILFFGLGAVGLVAYYLPLWFQAIKGITPIQSGIRFLPTVIANFVMSIVSGALVTKFGHYNPWLFLGSALTAVGGGLYSAWKVDVSNSMIIGIQVLAGSGGSLLIQMPIIGLMATLPESDLPIATSISVFFQFLGGAIFLGIAENVFVSSLKTALSNKAPNVNASAVVAAGAAGLHKVVGHADIPAVLEAYNAAITSAFYLCAAGGVGAFIFSFGMEWRSVKGKQVTGTA